MEYTSTLPGFRSKAKGTRKVGTPMVHMDPGADLDVPGLLASKCRSFIGSLMFLCRCSRPDICYAVCYLARHVHDWHKVHDMQLDRLMRFLRYTSDAQLHSNLGLMDRDWCNIELRCYVDADHGGDRDTRRSTSGATVFLYNRKTGEHSLVDWSSKRQPHVSLSSAESEVAAIVKGIKAAIRISRLMKFCLGNDVYLPIVILSDSTAAMAACKSGFSQKLLHMSRTAGINLAWVSDWLRVPIDTSAGQSLEKVGTLDNIADCMTKPLNPEAFIRQSQAMGIRYREPLMEEGEDRGIASNLVNRCGPVGLRRHSEFVVAFSRVCVQTLLSRR